MRRWLRLVAARGPTEVMRPSPIRLTSEDAVRYIAFRTQMLADAPWAFSADPDDDVALDPAFLRAALAKPDNAIMAIAGDEDSLIAAAGIYRVENPKFSHRAKLWGVFVDPRHRGHGLGSAVCSAALALAETWDGLAYVDVGVSENAPAALRLYQSLGFVVWGREPESTQYGARRFDEIFLALRVDRGANA